MNPAAVKTVSPHVLGAVSVLVGLAWTMRTTLAGGPALHWLVAPLALFVLGPRWAAIGVTLGAAFAGATGALPWSTVPATLVVDGFVPLAVAWAWLRMVERRLPPHLFVYLFAAVFAGTAVATLCSGALERMLFQAGSGVVTGADWWIALVILADGEAVTTGMLVSALAVFRPEWVQTFDVDRYLRRPGARRRDVR